MATVSLTQRAAADAVDALSRTSLAVNGYFWPMPHVGSGQYLHQLLPALADLSPPAARKWMENAPPGELLERASADLRTAYGWKLGAVCEGASITLRAHAMAVPSPGYLANPGLRALREADGPLQFAHADLSGYSVFEEAAWWGECCARRVLSA